MNEVSAAGGHKLIELPGDNVERGNSRTADAARDVTIRESFAYSLARKPGWKSREIIRAPWTSRIRLSSGHLYSPVGGCRRCLTK